jgi:hypothetical protein
MAECGELYCVQGSCTCKPQAELRFAQVCLVPVFTGHHGLHATHTERNHNIRIPGLHRT